MATGKKNTEQKSKHAIKTSPSQTLHFALRNLITQITMGFNCLKSAPYLLNQSVQLEKLVTWAQSPAWLNKWTQWVLCYFKYFVVHLHHHLPQWPIPTIAESPGSQAETPPGNRVSKTVVQPRQCTASPRVHAKPAGPLSATRTTLEDTNQTGTCPST